MATVLFGNGVADMRGSINGNVFSRNGNGGYVRNRTTPTNPSSQKQVAVRATLAFLSTYWRSLTNEQRDAWGTSTPNFPYTNRLGQSSVYSGQQLFMKFNQSLFQSGATTVLEVPPTPQSFPALIATTLTATLTAGVLTAFSIDFNGSDGSGDFEFQIFATPGMSAGISNPGSGSYRLLASAQGTEDSPLGLHTQYIALFGSPVAGQKIHVRVEVVALLSGQRQVVGLLSDIVS